MEALSVSKGCFVYKNNGTCLGRNAKKSTLKRKKSLQPAEDVVTTACDRVLDCELTQQPFYTVYAETWRLLQTDIKRLQHHNYARTLEELVTFIVNAGNVTRTMDDNGMQEILPAAALLTGINQPDHIEQFTTLSERINEQTSASVCVLESRDCSTLKTSVETLVYNFMEPTHEKIDEDEKESDYKRLRRSQCTMKQLQHWYLQNYEYSVKNSSENLSERRHLLVVILPDFECFSSIVLQDLIIVLSAHCGKLPFVIVLGVATAVSAIHSTLPYHVTSKIKLRVFQTQTAPVCFSEILEKVILSPKYAFQLSGKAFKFLTHIFLYYDFSINGFIQGFKYCLMEHFVQGNAYALCSTYANSLTKIKLLTHENMETIRHLPSFRPYVESINDCKRIIAILTDDAYLKKKLPQLLRDCHVHFLVRRVLLELLTVLVGDLPKCPLGKERRELYALCLSKELGSQVEFKECWQMLRFMSKDEFVTKVSGAIQITQLFLEKEIKNLELGADCAVVVEGKLQIIKEQLNEVVMAGVQQTSNTSDQLAASSLQQLSSRQDLRERLVLMSKQAKPQSEYEKSVHQLLTYIETEVLELHLPPLQRTPPLHELFVFTDISTVRRNIIGAPRAALHMALNNPHFYLQCKCCELQEQMQLLPTLPDLSVAYKLHLECGRMINLFDWLQAFRSVVDSSEDEHEQVDPKIQARFTRAVAELQFLGYIKMSKRKTDHATRLTW